MASSSILEDILAFSHAEQDKLIMAILQSRSSSSSEAPKPAKKGRKPKAAVESSESETSEPKPKREQSEGQKAWNAEVSAVWAEMKATDPTVKRSAALSEASRRRKASASSE
jgi:hypothetical protein